LKLKARIKRLEARLPGSENRSEDLSKELDLLYAAFLNDGKKEPKKFWFETTGEFEERLKRYKKEILAEKEILEVKSS